MVANFFKQSKPIVFLILGIVLSFFYYLKVIGNQELYANGEKIVILIINHIILILSFILFELSIKRYEIQKGHSFVSLFFVLFIGIIIQDITFSYELLGFLLLNFGILRMLAFIESTEKNLCIFEAVLFITISSFFYKPFILCLILVLTISLLFSRPNWRYFVIPFFSISTVVIFVESYFLLRNDTIAELSFFVPEIEYSLEAYYSKLSPLLIIFWVVSSLVCVYQIFMVKQIRSLYHRDMASFFLVFLILALISFCFQSSTLSGLWLMSLWPLCIYLGDFISRIKKPLWLQIAFWFFVLVPISIYILTL